MSESMLTFEWDDANREHIAQHLVLPDEVEEIFSRETFEVNSYNIRGEDRFEELGITDSGRILFVVSTVRRDRLRIVTAYDATRNQKAEFLAFQRSFYE
jgi:uncharacterized DUF497 family protein